MRVCLKCGHSCSPDGWACPACGYEPDHLNGFVAHAADLADAGSGFKPEYFAELSRLEAANFWFRVRNKVILWALRTYQPRARNFLEVGCGTGFVLSGIAKAHPEIILSGSELFLAGLPFAAERVPNSNLMQMDARRIPYEDEFDTIGAFDVLEHIEEDKTVLTQLHKALKSDGVLLLTVPQHPWLWSDSDEYACHIRRYTRLEIETKVRDQGFEILRSSSFVTSLLPAMILSRWLQKLNNKSFDPDSELSLNSAVNETFYGLMMLDLAGLRLGFNYPIGGSRLIVAKKSA